MNPFRRYLFRQLYIVTLLHPISLATNSTGSFFSKQRFKASIFSSVEKICFVCLDFLPLTSLGLSVFLSSFAH